MAYEQGLDPITIPAGSDLSSSQYRFMTINSSKQLAATASGLSADGVLQDAPDAQGKLGSLQTKPGAISKLQMGEACSVGDVICPGTAGKGRVASTTGDVIAAKALEAATADGDIISVLLKLQVEPAA